MFPHLLNVLVGGRKHRETIYHLCFISLFISYLGITYSADYDFVHLAPETALNTRESNDVCEGNDSNLPFLTNKNLNDDLAALMRTQQIDSVFLDANIKLFPWMRTDGKVGENVSPSAHQGCYTESPTFREVHSEGRYSFKASDCKRRCSEINKSYFAIKGKERKTFGTDTISCSCGSSMNGLTQKASSTCPEECGDGWCRVENSKRSILVFSTNSPADGFTWEEAPSNFDNRHTCGLHIGSERVRKENCGDKYPTMCVDDKGIRFKSNRSLTWFLASQFCNEIGAHLPTIEEYKTSGEITSFWSSLTARHLSRYTDGDPVGFTHWKTTLPLSLSSSHVCVAMDKEGWWYDISCSTMHRGVVCQKEVPFQSTSEPYFPTSFPFGESTTSDSTYNTTSVNETGLIYPPGDSDYEDQGRSQTIPLPATKRMSPATIAGIVIGVILGVVIVIAVILLLLVICSRRSKNELPRATRDSRIYRVSTDGNEYVSMTGRGGSSYSATSRPNGIPSQRESLPNGHAETELGPDEVFDPTYSLATHPRLTDMSGVSMVDNDVYSETGSPVRRTMTSDSSCGLYDVPSSLRSGGIPEEEADTDTGDSGVYSVPRLSRQATVISNQEGSGGYVEADMSKEPPPAPHRTNRAGADDEDDEVGVPSPGGRIPSTASAASSSSQGTENHSYQPERQTSTSPYDIPETVDPKYIEGSPNNSPTYGNISSPTREPSSDHIYVNTLLTRPTSASDC